MLFLAAIAHARELRDVIGTFDHVQTSEHFALKWGDLEPDAAVVQATLDSLEAAWAVEVDEAGYPAPREGDAWYLNVYVGNSGGETPTIDFSGGYVQEDAEGFAYIVLSADAVALFSGADPTGIGIGDPVSWAGGVCAHEFFHTLEFGTDAYVERDRTNFWVWESGANYASYLVVPQVELAWYQSLYYLTTPYLPLTGLGETGPDAPYAASRSYGVWLWWAYLDEVVGAPELMREMWTTDSPDAKPLTVLLDLMEARSLDFPTLFLDFAVHNATYDYSFGAGVAGYMEADEQVIGGERIVATWDAAGTGDWQSPVEIYGLHRVSYNVIEVEAPGAQSWVVEVDTDDESVLAAVLVPRADGVERVDLVDGEAVVDTTAEDTTLLLVVACTSVAEADSRTISYAYRLTPTPTSDADDPATGCGCGTSAAPLPIGVLLAMVAAAARRFPSRSKT